MFLNKPSLNESTDLNIKYDLSFRTIKKLIERIVPPETMMT